MTKIDIINKISEQIGLQKPDSETAVETIISLVKQALGKGDGVILRRFGSFQVRQKRERIGRNPKTGKEASITARKVVRFKAGKYFKTAVNT
jgi:integration host factor subunit alpha